MAAAGAVCVGAACASGPQQRPPPVPENCPTGAWEAQWEIGIRPFEARLAYFSPTEKSAVVQVQEGDVTVWIADSGDFPDDTRMSGRIYFDQGRVHGRFTQALYPTGEVIPVCFQLMGLAGTEMEPGSTSDKVLMSSPVELIAVTGFSTR
jgi:eukaryotic-like serine/threonine-protein kinase